MPLWSRARLFFILAALGPWHQARGQASWQVVGGGDLSSGAAQSGSMALDRTSWRPVCAYQDSTFVGSRARRFDGVTWQDFAGSLSFGAAWYHILAFGHPPGQSAWAPFAFMRDYGNPFGDGTLSYFDPAQQTWNKVNAAATSFGSHDVWIDINCSNPASPYYNVPIVSFGNRDLNPTVFNHPVDPYSDAMSVRAYSFSQNAFIPIGAAGFDSNVTATTVRVSRNGTIIAAYMKVVTPNPYGSNQHANVRRFDPQTGVWVPLGPANFSSFNSGGLQIMGITNLSMVLDRNEVPWVAFVWGTNVLVMKYDPATDSWSQVGGYVNGTVAASFPQESWRYRVPLAFDFDNRPYVFYSLTFPLTAAQNSKGVVRRFNGATWDLVGASGFTPGGASYHSMEIDPVDAIYCGFRNMLTDKAMVMKFASPYAIGPVTVGMGTPVAPGLPALTLAANGNPVAGSPSTLTLSNGALGEVCLFYAGSPVATPFDVGGGAFVYLGPDLFPIGTASANGAGTCSISVNVPAGLPPGQLAVQAAVMKSSGGFAVTNAIRTAVIP